MRQLAYLPLSEYVEMCTSKQRGLCGYCLKFHPFFYLVVSNNNYLATLHRDPYLVTIYERLYKKKKEGYDLPVHIAKLTTMDLVECGMIAGRFVD